MIFSDICTGVLGSTGTGCSLLMGDTDEKINSGFRLMLSVVDLTANKLTIKIN
jgi:hypothetical protein